MSTYSNCYLLFVVVGNLLSVYPSGISVATALGIQQGDVSLCCRGLKYSVGNYRFRFLGDTEDQYEVVKRRKLEMATAVVDPTEDLSTSGRSRRVSRGDYHVKVSDKDDHGKSSRNRNQYNGPKPSEIVGLEARKWEKKQKQFGTFCVDIWVPNKPEPNPQLREYLPSKKTDLRKSKSGRRTSVQLQSRY